MLCCTGTICLKLICRKSADRLKLYTPSYCLWAVIFDTDMHCKNKIFILREHLSKQKFIFQTDKTVLL